MGGQVAVADKEGPGTLVRFSVRLPPVTPASAEDSGLLPSSLLPPPAPMTAGYVRMGVSGWKGVLFMVC